MAEKSIYKFYLFFVVLMKCTIIMKSDFRNEECSHNGWGCLDCTHRKMCLSIFWGPLKPVGDPKACGGLLTGKSSTYCDPETDQCVAYVPPACTSCLRKDTKDTYPNLADCQRYYICDDTTDMHIPQTCTTGRVYRQQWGKCVINLNTETDCNVLTECPETALTYPGDPSLYYKCSMGSKVSSLLACPSYIDIYDPITESCDTNQCADDETSLAIPHKCTAYYDCKSHSEVSCPIDMGYHSHSKQCALYYNHICNELNLIETNVKSIFGESNFIYGAMSKFFNLVKWNPYTAVFFIPVSNAKRSAAILIADYIYKRKHFPPGLINYLVEFSLNRLPHQFKSAMDIVLKFLPFKLSSDNRLSKIQVIALALEKEFANIDFLATIKLLRNIKSPGKAFQTFITHVSNKLHITTSSLFGLLQIVVPIVVAPVNGFFGDENLLLLQNKRLTFDHEGLWRIFENGIEHTLKVIEKFNEDIAKFIKTLVDKTSERQRQIVQYIANKFYLPLYVEE